MMAEKQFLITSFLLWLVLSSGSALCSTRHGLAPNGSPAKSNFEKGFFRKPALRIFRLKNNEAGQAPPVFIHVEKIYPNPAVDYIEISMDAAGDGTVELKIYAIDGSLKKLEKNIPVAKGLQQFTITVNDLPQGAYLLEACYYLNGNKIICSTHKFTRMGI